MMMEHRHATPLAGVALTGLVLACSSPAAAQSLMLSEQVPVGKIAKDLPPGLTAKDVVVLEAIRLRVATIGAAKPVPSAAAVADFNADKTGLLLSADGNGGIRAVEVPTAKTGEFGVDRDLLEAFRATPKSVVEDRIASLFGPTGGRWVNAGDIFKSINPETVVAFTALTGDYKKSAAKWNWAGPTAAADSSCTAAQKEFVAAKVQGELENPNGNAYRWRNPQDRPRWLAAIHGYQDNCLVPVPTKGVEAARLPIARLAVLTLADGQPVCMALHLGGDRFVTARHCFFDANGTFKEQLKGAWLSMVDQSDDPRLVDPVKNEPWPTAQPWSSARDVVLIQVPTLAKAVRDRAVALDFTDAGVANVGQPALAIGYFPLADPERSIPAEPGENGKAPPWNTSLRMTRVEGKGYCRVWDSSAAAADGSRCIEHSCQTTTGFSGTPVFVNRGTEEVPVWSVIGLNVDDAFKKDAAGCGSFSSGQTGLMRLNGSIAAAVPKRLYTTQIAMNQQLGVKP